MLQRSNSIASVDSNLTSTSHQSLNRFKRQDSSTIFDYLRSPAQLDGKSRRIVVDMNDDTIPIGIWLKIKQIESHKH
jgi:hypothetical protein